MSRYSQFVHINDDIEPKTINQSRQGTAIRTVVKDIQNVLDFCLANACSISCENGCAKALIIQTTIPV